MYDLMCVSQHGEVKNFTDDGADSWNSEGGLLPDYQCIDFTSHESRQAVISRTAKECLTD